MAEPEYPRAVGAVGDWGFGSAPNPLLDFMHFEIGVIEYFGKCEVTCVKNIACQFALVHACPDD